MGNGERHWWRRANASRFANFSLEGSNLDDWAMAAFSRAMTANRTSRFTRPTLGRCRRFDWLTATNPALYAQWFVIDTLYR